MHTLIVTDQHPTSLGGAQVSIRLQRKYFEHAGHTVSIVAPRNLASTEDRAAHETGEVHGLDIDLPALAITRDRSYGAAWPGRSSLRLVLQALREAQQHNGTPLVDLVHVQGDFWGGLLGYRIARELGVPVVHTVHNNLETGTRAVTKLAPAMFVALNVTRRIFLGRPAHRVTGSLASGWRYLAELAAEADAVIAPSHHFARTLREYAEIDEVEVIPTGVDDHLLDDLLSEPSNRLSTRGDVAFVWVGRMSPEKRPRELLQAFLGLGADHGTDTAPQTTLTMVGSGIQFEELRTVVTKAGAEERVRFTGSLPYRDALTAIRDADALVQTSVGFETQGMTPYEAAALGTPTVFCDANIHAEVGVEPSWLASDQSIEKLTEALAAAAGDLRTPGGKVRVPGDVATRFRQSHRAEQLLEIYRRTLSPAS